MKAPKLYAVILILSLSLLAACQTSAPAHDLPLDVADYLDTALHLMESRSLHADEIDCPRFRQEIFAHAAGAEQPADAYDALRLAVEKLGDRHSRFLTPAEVAAIEAGADNQPPEAYLAEERFGYLWLPGYTGGDQIGISEHAGLIQEMIERVDEAGPCGWIIDLRQNRGGNMWPMLAGVGPLLGEGYAGSFVDRYGQEGRWKYRDGQAQIGDNTLARVVGPAYLPDYLDRPVALLIGAETASSGEAIVIAFHGRPETRFFGQTTAGRATANAFFPLSDGAALVLTTGVMVDRFGEEFSDGIAPHLWVDPDLDAAAANDLVLAEATAWLQDTDFCQNR